VLAATLTGSDNHQDSGVTSLSFLFFGPPGWNPARARALVLGRKPLWVAHFGVQALKKKSRIYSESSYIN
jgi:hypothetical protein